VLAYYFCPRSHSTVAVHHSLPPGWRIKISSRVMNSNKAARPSSVAHLGCRKAALYLEVSRFFLHGRLALDRFRIVSCDTGTRPRPNLIPFPSDTRYPRFQAKVIRKISTSHKIVLDCRKEFFQPYARGYPHGTLSCAPDHLPLKDRYGRNRSR
jgi:hypothetical protein